MEHEQMDRKFGDIDDEFGKLWDAHGKLKEEQIRIREHMSARFDSQDRRISEVEEGLRREIQAGDANNAKRHEELKYSITETLKGLAASNPIWFTAAIATVAAGVAVLVTWLGLK